MATSSLYRRLVPDAPQYRRTEGDVYATPEDERRARLAPRLAAQVAKPGLRHPALVSSWQGAIEEILFAFPTYGVASAELAAGYKSVVAALRPGTKFVVVHHESRRFDVAEWFDDAGHPAGNVTYVPLPDYVTFTDWAEDAYVALLDTEDGTSYLMEPWEFPRAGDALVSESVQEHVSLRSAQAPLIFQGGNCLIGDRFWLLGKDYFADSVALVEGRNAPVTIPPGTTAPAFVTRLFADYLDAGRELLVVGTERPIPLREFYGTREDDTYFLDIAGDGVGTFQPIFHIDMFITLVGAGAGQRFQVLVGSPALGAELTGSRSPFALDDVYDSIAAQLAAAGMRVERNPLVHRPEIGPSFTVVELRLMANQPGNESLLPAVKDLVGAGAREKDVARVRTWHHVTWNNCLVENGGGIGRHVYLPTYGHFPNEDLEPVDEEMRALWERLGFEVHLLGDFNPFAQRQGVVHCIKKYLRRGE
ncbi:MAG TPA: hypothetical protein VM388_02190 [Acidimicrobiales bacterium]|nr:hypothetical protein [Acidimicrobiales bacterium]